MTLIKNYFTDKNAAFFIKVLEFKIKKIYNPHSLKCDVKIHPFIIWRIGPRGRNCQGFGLVLLNSLTVLTFC